MYARANPLAGDAACLCRVMVDAGNTVMTQHVDAAIAE
jgi:hypothetical protein